MFMNFSSPECVTWLTLGVTESAVVVAGNLITIIVFMKNNHLRKRSLYLVINLTVADMLAGGIFSAQIFFTLDSHCKFSEFNLGSYRSDVLLYFAIYFLFYLFPLTSLTNIAMISPQQARATFVHSSIASLKSGSTVQRLLLSGCWLAHYQQHWSH